MQDECRKHVEFKHLHDAIRKKNLKKVRYSITAGANVNEIEDNDAGKTLLHVAVETGSVEIIKLLLDAGADVKIKDAQGQSVLNGAFKKESSFRAITLLAKAGADLKDCRDAKGNTIIHHAARINSIKFVKYLLSEKINEVDVKNFYDETPLHLAAKHCVNDSHYDTIELLLKNGADVNAVNATDGSTPLHCLIENSNFKSIQLLLSHGADVNIKNSKEKIPLFLAVTLNHVNVVKLLIDFGSEVNDAKYTLTPLHEAAALNYGDSYFEVMRILLKNGAAVNAPAINGMTPMHYLIKCGVGSRMVRLLLSFGANFNLRDRHGNTPLYDAVCCNQTEIVQLLIDHGYDVNNVYYGRTILHEAIKRSYNVDMYVMTEILLKKWSMCQC